MTDDQILEALRKAASIGEWIKVDDLWTIASKKAEKFSPSAMSRGLDRLVLATRIQSELRYDGPIIKRYVCLDPSELGHAPDPDAFQKALDALSEV